MKNASQIMYKIGKIINIVVIVIFAILIVVNIVTLGAAAAVDGDVEAKAVAIGAAVGGMVTSIIFLALAIVALVVANKAINAIGDGQENRKPHIICIVMGAISENPFYILGGIFGLIAESQENG